MKKDIQNVLVTFSLLAMMLYGGSFVYTKKVIAEDQAMRIEEHKLAEELLAQERTQAELEKINEEQEEQLEKKRLEEEARLAEAKKIKEAVVVKNVQPTSKTTTPVTVTPQPDPAIVAAQKKAQADLLAEQVALAKKEAEKLAQQKIDAAAKKAATKASRKSRAS